MDMSLLDLKKTIEADFTDTRHRSTTLNTGWIYSEAVDAE